NAASRTRGRWRRNFAEALYPATASRAVLLVGTVTQPGRHSGVGLRLHGLQRGDSLFRAHRGVRQDAIALLLRRFLEVVNFSGKPRTASGKEARLRVQDGGSRTMQSKRGTIFSCGFARVWAFNQSNTFATSKEHVPDKPLAAAFRAATAMASSLWSIAWT